MLGIIICDDDKFTLQISVRFAKQAIEKSRINAEIVCISSRGQEVIRFYEKNPKPYLYFMDYDMGVEKLNGIDISRQIKQREPLSKIVFVTSYSDKGTDILKSGVEAFGFIEKSLDEKMMVLEYTKYIGMMDRFEKEKRNEEEVEDFIELPVGIDEFVELPISQIVYVDSVKTTAHFICYHTLDGSKITKRDTLEHALSVLGNKFIRSHRSVLINKNYVIGMHNGLVKLSNGEMVDCAFGKKDTIIRECLKKKGDN